MNGFKQETSSINHNNKPLLNISLKSVQPLKYAFFCTN